MKSVMIAVFALSLSPVWAADEAANPLDPITVGKGIYSLKSEDADTRVMEVTFKPGQAIDLHQHPKHVVHVLKPGELTINTEGKEPQVMKLKAGDTVIMPAEKHSAKNTGKSLVKVLVVELKGKS